MASSSSSPPVLVRQVWAFNLHWEMALIKKILPHYPVVSFDTEFPGLVFQPKVDNKLCTKSRISPSYNYQIIKANVDALNIIQLGLSLCDAQGNLPQLDTDYCFVWEFNFQDFDIHRDLQNPDSIQLLRNQGIDFENNRVNGIHSWEFTRQIFNTGLLLNFNINWVTFHSAYDFGYLIKILTFLAFLIGSVVERWFGGGEEWVVRVSDVGECCRVWRPEGERENRKRGRKMKSYWVCLDNRVSISLVGIILFLIGLCELTNQYYKNIVNKLLWE